MIFFINLKSFQVRFVRQDTPEVFLVQRVLYGSHRLRPHHRTMIYPESRQWYGCCLVHPTVLSTFAGDHGCCLPIPILDLIRKKCSLYLSPAALIVKLKCRILLMNPCFLICTF